jgi:hypothetical protein
MLNPAGKVIVTVSFAAIPVGVVKVMVWLAAVDVAVVERRSLTWLRDTARALGIKVGKPRDHEIRVKRRNVAILLLGVLNNAI